MELIYGKEGQLRFNSQEDLYVAVRFLANANIRIYIEPNQLSGAQAEEWRISFYDGVPNNIPLSLRSSIKPNKDGTNPRLNNLEFINKILKERHYFQLTVNIPKKTQDIETIRNSIPNEYQGSFDMGLDLASL